MHAVVDTQFYQIKYIKYVQLGIYKTMILSCEDNNMKLIE